MKKDPLSFESQYSRLLSASGAKSDTELARVLGISQGGVSSAKKRLKIPAEWVKQIALKTGADTNWLFFGHPASRQKAVTGQHDVNEPCSQCHELELELKEERAERRRLSKELMEINTENRQLLRENGELKAELAELKARAAPDADTVPEGTRRSA